MKSKLSWLIPAIFLYLAFFIIPVILNVITCFYKTNILTWRFVGFGNFVKLVTDKVFLSACFNTLCYVIIVPIVIIPFTLFLVLTVYDLKKVAHDYIRFTFFLPGYASGIIISSAFRLIFYPGSEGIVNTILSWVHIKPIIWFSTDLNSVLAISIIQSTQLLGSFIVIFLAALMSIDRSTVEAAKIDGCLPGQIKRLILIPQIMPTIWFMALCCSAGQLNIVEYIYALCPYNHSQTVIFNVWQEAFLYNNFGMASAKIISVIIIAFSAIMIGRRIRKE